MPDEHFDAVVVGSGFGGSAMTYRLAEAGLRVLLLERGRPYPPGSFPRTPHGLKRNFWDPSEGLYGMFNVWSFPRFEAVVSSGLGGGSLIYANVLLRKDEKWFVQEDLRRGGYEHWPVTRAALDPYYDRAERMIGVQTYPLGKEPYRRTRKTHALREATERLRAQGRDVTWDLPPLAVTFANDGDEPVPGEPIREAHPNLHGRTRLTCTLCGECDAGCNTGSKNTLDYTYLSHAQRLGAEIRPLCEVRAFQPNGSAGYTVRYVRHDPDAEARPPDHSAPPLHTVTADRLVLAAGALGTTYLLLKNRAHLPALSPRLGTRFCGNGDLLSFALRCCDEQDGTRTPRVMDPNFGPVITSTLRHGDGLDGGGSTGRGFYIQDAGYPAFMSWIVESADALGAARRLFRFVRQRVWARLTRDPDTDLSAEVQAILGDVASSTSVPLLGMGRDVPDGTFSLRRDRHGRDRLDCDWRLDGSRHYFDRVRDTMREIVDVWGGEFVMNPTWLLRRVVTVHPLGGAPMGRTPDEGVVGPTGEVFGHPGLYIADGAALPGPVGANPALTIAALAERSADHIIEQAAQRRTIHADASS